MASESRLSSLPHSDPSRSSSSSSSSDGSLSRRAGGRGGKRSRRALDPPPPPGRSMRISIPPMRMTELRSTFGSGSESPRLSSEGSTSSAPPSTSPSCSSDVVSESESPRTSGLRTRLPPASAWAYAWCIWRCLRFGPPPYPGKNVPGAAPFKATKSPASSAP